MSDVIYTPLIDEMVWSYSRVSSFSDCKYCWYLKYICGLDESCKQFFSEYGSFMHKLLEKLYSTDITKEKLVSEYITGFKDNVTSLPMSLKVFDNYFASGLSYLRNIERFPYQTVAVEKKFRTKIGSRNVYGIIDYIGQDDNGFVIIDHKSRTLKPRSKGNKYLKSDEELDSYLKQLYLYAYALHEEYGEYPHTLAFNCFRTNTDTTPWEQRKSTLIKEEFHKQKMDETIAWFEKSIEEISHESDFKPTIEQFKCENLCGMRDVCEYYAMNFKKGARR